MYVAALQKFNLLESVMPDSTEIVLVDDVPMRKFKLTMYLDPDVEASFDVVPVGATQDSMAAKAGLGKNVAAVSDQEGN